MSVPEKNKLSCYPHKFVWSREIESVFVKNKIFLKNAFLIRGVIPTGKRMEIPGRILVEQYATMSGMRGFVAAGAFSYSHSPLGDKAKIGRYCSIASGVTVIGPEHPLDLATTHPVACRRYFADFVKKEFNGDIAQDSYAAASRGKIRIGHDVWIGKGAMIRGGVTIGHGAVVAGGAVVVKDIEPYMIVGGNPARAIRRRFSDSLVENLMECAWWRYRPDAFSGLSFSDPKRFAGEVRERAAAEVISEFVPPTFDILSLISSVDSQ